MANALRSLAKTFAESTRDRGIVTTLHIASSTIWCNSLDNLDEWVYRTRTSVDVSLETLQIQSPNKAHATPFSSPSHYRIIRKTLKALGKLRGREFSDSVLVDLGCGKGRVLLVGSEFGFRKVIGVEFSPDLCRLAEENISTYYSRRRKPTEIQIVNADVTNFEIPPDANVLFLFAAFDGLVLEQVTQNIVVSREKFPHEIWVIYVKASCGEILEKHGFQSRLQLTWCGFPTKIYHLT